MLTAEAATDSFDEIDYGREFQDYLDPGIQDAGDRIQGRRSEL